MRSSDLHKGDAYTDKTTSLFWIGPRFCLECYIHKGKQGNGMLHCEIRVKWLHLSIPTQQNCINKYINNVINAYFVNDDIVCQLMNYRKI